MSDSLLQHIEKISLIKHNRDLIHSLCGLDVEVRRIDGTAVGSTKRNPSSTASQSKSVCPCGQNFRNCPSIESETLSKVYDTFQPQSFVCSAGLRKIVIPIVINRSLVGLLFTGENKDFHFKGDQINEMVKLLTQFTDYVIKNELTPMDINMYSNGAVTRQQELLNRAVLYVKQNYHNNDMTLREVSSKSGISYHYLSRIFKKELNTTFAQFRNKVRMEAAKKMLKNRSLSVSQISFACGFDDPTYFCKVFRSSFGTSPTNYRLQKHTSKKRLI
ncbi:MAG: helix-turn-helix transcriptional regulator [Candidatus Omnitrophica bacterium]|nr:helix-turn-helix transcriptional regulator [Candidatus Omnitrophota bacterium]